jgi:hypothetical protein
VTIRAKKFYATFQCSAPESSLKRQILPSSNEFRLYWINIDTEIYSDPEKSSPSIVINTGTITGIVVAALVVIAIIAIVFIISRRNQNIAVELLPAAIIKHYLHHSRFPLSWDMKGHDASISYIRRLNTLTKPYEKMHLLWSMMGGSNIEIDEAYAVYSPNQLVNFANKWNSTMTQVKSNPGLFINKQWKQKSEDLRVWVHDQYLQKVSQFNWNETIEVPIIPALHGTDESVAYSIITTSFVALAKGDAGYYGKGLYFTTSAEYALPYFATKPSPTVLICFLITGNSYPVIEHPRAKENLMGTALKPNFHSHYILCRIDGNPVPHILENKEESYYDEIVIEQESCVVPYYLLKIKKDKLVALALDIQKRQEKLRLEENTKDINIRTSNNTDTRINSQREGRNVKSSQKPKSPKKKLTDSLLNILVTDPKKTSDSSSSDDQDIEFERLSDL